jgi:hypothetical protein
MFITNPKVFAEWFNEKYPSTYYRITPEDINEMTACGLIHCYGYYSESKDGETVRDVLQYEQMREKRIGRDDAKVVNSQPTCKGCGQPLPAPPPEKKGRHGEYCVECQSSRSRERYRKWRKKRQT